VLSVEEEEEEDGRWLRGDEKKTEVDIRIPLCSSSDLL
jgi:hypothetical protein